MISKTIVLSDKFKGLLALGVLVIIFSYDCFVGVLCRTTFRAVATLRYLVECVLRGLRYNLHPPNKRGCKDFKYLFCLTANTTETLFCSCLN